MCGFAGVIAWNDRYCVTRETLARMSACIAHRGPDGAGEWINHHTAVAPATPQAALAHRRLAIIDPDPRGNQPFGDAQGRQIVFNGEIYNFLELREELGRLRPDLHWRTECDTEVLLAAYQVWGEGCCERLDGMFAFAIWDAPAGVLFLARDRMGQKPLYAAIAPDDGAGRIGAVAFASELSALRELSWVDQATDMTAVEHYLRWGYIPAPMTIYRGCEKLPPARWMRVRPQELEVAQYFDANRAAAGEEVSADRVRHLVNDAVRRQLIADVPVGCFLSGGIDSSVVAAAMKSAVGAEQPVLTFAIGFEDPRYDETEHAAEVARHLGTQHRAFTVRPNAAEDLPKLAAVFGEPFADSSALPTHYLARETRQHVKVALSGDGGDELFAGYDRYRALWLGESFRAMPAGLRKVAMSKLWERLPGTHPKSTGARVKKLLSSLDLPAAQRYDVYMRIFDEAAVGPILPPGNNESPAKRWLAQAFTALNQGRDVVQTALALDRLTYLPEDLLTKVDRAAMLHALEVRSPFMDPALVQFAAGLTTEALLGAPHSAASFMQSPMTTPAKRLLRKAFASKLPSSVFKRRKMGFAVPIGDWFRGELRSLLRDAVMAKGSFAVEHFHGPSIANMLSEHHAGVRDHSQRLYALLMLELWWRQARPG